MNTGTRYTFPESFYPSYAYFKEQLHDFVPRFERIVKAGDLAPCILKGETQLDEIKRLSKCFTETVNVSVLNETYTRRIDRDKLVIKYYKDEENDCTEVWDPIKDISAGPCHIVVWSIASEKQHYRLLRDLCSPTPYQEENIVIYDATNDKAYDYLTYKQMSTIGGQSSSGKGGQMFSKGDNSSKSLCEQIEMRLEMQIIAVFDKMAGFIGKLIPRPIEDDPNKTAMSAVRSALENSLKDRHVISDLSPHTSKIAEGTTDTIDPSTISDEEKQKRNDDFHKKLNDFVGKKVKFALCGYFSTKLGISPSIANEFLNEGYFNLEKRVEVICHTIQADDWPFEYGVDGAVFVCKKYAYDCKQALSDMVTKAEGYMADKMKILNKMKRLQFELHAVLKMTNVPHTTVVPEIPKLSTDLQDALLGISEIDGCGHIYGQLTFHISDKLSEETTTIIDSLLKKYDYPAGYTHKIVVNSKQAGGSLLTHGSAIRVEGTGDTGTLGCFVNLKPNGEDTHNQLHGISCAHCVDTEGDMIETCIDDRTNEFVKLGTVSHRLYHPDFLDIALIQVETDKIKDCATELKKHCGFNTAATWHPSNTLPPPGLMVYKIGASSGPSKGTIVSDDFITKTVKDRANSETQAQAIAMDDTASVAGTENDEESTAKQTAQAKGMEDTTSVAGTENDKGIIAKKRAPNLDREYSILIAPREDEQEGTTFSEPGDSGSTICIHDIKNTRNVLVMGLLCGSIDGKSDNKYICTHASFMHRLIEIIQDRFNCSITPAFPNKTRCTDGQTGVARNTSQGPTPMEGVSVEPGPSREQEGQDLVPMDGVVESKSSGDVGKRKRLSSPTRDVLETVKRSRTDDDTSVHDLINRVGTMQASSSPGEAAGAAEATSGEPRKETRGCTACPNHPPNGTWPGHK